MSENHTPLEKVAIGAVVAPAVIVLFYIALIPFVLFQGWAAWLMYGWFVQPLGAPDLSYWHVVGLLLFWAILRNKVDKGNDKIEHPIMKLFMVLFITLLTLLLGYVIKGWI